jgi:hypothetical protein
MAAAGATDQRRRPMILDVGRGRPDYWRRQPPPPVLCPDRRIRGRRPRWRTGAPFSVSPSPPPGLSTSASTSGHRSCGKPSVLPSSALPRISVSPVPAARSASVCPLEGLKGARRLSGGLRDPLFEMHPSLWFVRVAAASAGSGLSVCTSLVGNGMRTAMTRLRKFSDFNESPRTCASTKLTMATEAIGTRMKEAVGRSGLRAARVAAPPANAVARVPIPGDHRRRSVTATSAPQIGGGFAGRRLRYDEGLSSLSPGNGTAPMTSLLSIPLAGGIRCIWLAGVPAPTLIWPSASPPGDSWRHQPCRPRPRPSL